MDARGTGTGIGAPPRRVLVIDDDPMIRRLLQRVISGRGAQVFLAASGPEGLALAQAESFDLIITDLMMPGMDGAAVLAQFRERYPGIPVVILTGSGDYRPAVDCLKNGAFDYLNKPLRLEQLQDLLDRAIQERRRRLELQRRDYRESVRAGQIFAGYHLDELIGEGAVGMVFLASRADGREPARAALKVLRPELVVDDENLLQERFTREADAAMTVQHPNVLRIFEYGLERNSGMPYLVMEYFPSQSLRFLAAHPERLDHRQRTFLLLQAARALEAIHEHGICHRDIKPQNILVNEQFQVKVADFGLAQMSGAELTLSGDILGTPAYLSPEAFRSTKVDARSDLFSLGSVAYHLYFGCKPFAGQEMLDFAHSVRHALPAHPTRHDPQFPPTLTLILARLLRKKRSQRYQSAAALIADLNAFLDDRPLDLPLWERLCQSLGKDWS